MPRLCQSPDACAKSAPSLRAARNQTERGTPFRASRPNLEPYNGLHAGFVNQIEDTATTADRDNDALSAAGPEWLAERIHRCEAQVLHAVHQVRVLFLSGQSALECALHQILAQRAHKVPASCWPICRPWNATARCIACGGT
jgi:hypothetical protein